MIRSGRIYVWVAWGVLLGLALEQGAQAGLYLPEKHSQPDIEQGS
jgi:hypothetical protein